MSDTGFPPQGGPDDGLPIDVTPPRAKDRSLRDSMQIGVDGARRFLAGTRVGSLWRSFVRAAAESPAMVFAASLLVPGFGHVMLGRWRRGAAAFGAVLTLVALVAVSPRAGYVMPVQIVLGALLMMVHVEVWRSAHAKCGLAYDPGGAGFAMLVAIIWTYWQFHFFFVYGLVVVDYLYLRIVL